MNKRIPKAIFSIDFVIMAALVAWLLHQLNTGQNLPVIFLWKAVVENSLFAVLYFFNIYVLYPKLANRFYGVPYLLAAILAILLLVNINLAFSGLIGIDQYFINLYSKPDEPFIPNHHWTKTWITGVSVIILAISIVSVVGKRLLKQQIQFEVSEKERVSAELAFLKAQINPHFFFNTLHTIYALMDTNPGSAKSSIYSLSHMMRYVLYETKNEQTWLSKEIQFNEDYIALMKVRIPKGVQVIFEQQTKLPDVLIAPMLFLPFVENAFKHGVSAVNPSYVSIEIFKKNNQLIFEIQNSLFKGLAKQLDEDEGIGVANTKRRLDLLYPGKYELDIEQDDLAMEYIVKLKLNIYEDQ